MYHMLMDQIEAYRRAVADTTKARTVLHLQANLDNEDEWDNNLRSCVEEEQVRLDGLLSVVKMLIQEAAIEEPHDPYSINGDVNQAPVSIRSRLQQTIDDDPQERTTRPRDTPPKWSKVLRPPPPRTDN